MNSEVVSYGSAVSGNSLNSLSLSATISNANNRMILVFVASEDNPTNTNITPSSVTFNGVAMSYLTAAELNNSPTNSVRGSLYKLDGQNVPEAGTYSIVANFPGSIKARGLLYVCVKNVARIEPTPEATSATTNNGNTISGNIANVSPSALIVAFAMSQNSGGYTAGSGQTIIDQAATGNNEITVGASSKVVASPGYNTLTMTHSNGERQSLVLVCLAFYEELGGTIL